MSAVVHATALVEEGVELGPGTRIWSHVHLRGPCRIGADCIVGEKTYIAYDVTVGDRVKINAFVYLCTGVTLEDGVMVAAGVRFTNDRFPRATTPDLQELRPSEPDEHTLTTRVREGATLGAGSVVGCDLTIGRFAMVGMGSVVTRPVPDFHLVVGNPARSTGAVCRCGPPIARWRAGAKPPQGVFACSTCGRSYRISGDEVVERPAGVAESVIEGRLSGAGTARS